MANELIKAEPKAQREKVSLPIGLSVFFVVVFGLVFIGFQVREWLIDEQQLPIQRIVFTGEIDVIDTRELEREIRRQFGQSFFAVDVNQVHYMLESQPWVYTASIRKRWPSSLYIHIVEQQAVAVWNADLLLNRFGDTFDGFYADIELPQLYGPNGSEKTALVGYNNMASLLQPANQAITEVFLSERFAWKLRLDNDIVLNLGRLEFINRLQRYIDYYPEIVAQQKPIDYVDLRYDTGMAVGWAVADSQVEQTVQ